MTIGGTAATGVVFGSATSITAVTPAGTAGAKNVVVTNPDTQTGTLTNGFTYFAAAAPTVTSLVPNFGGQTETLTAVQINGTNLTGATAVTFTGTGVTASGIVVVNANQITANIVISPAAAGQQ